MLPQPILKRAHSARPSGSSHPPLLPPQVHWPSSPSLTRTFSAHSPAQYDRSPIEVSPNTCELPARGCPGRTYYDGGQPGTAPSPKHLFSSSKALHPRAIAAYEAKRAKEEIVDDDDETELERTPTRTSPYIPLPVQPPIHQSPYSAPMYPSYSVPPPSYLGPPPLVPDLSSSSDESDGFVSPPPEPAQGLYGGASSKYPYFGYPNQAPPQPLYPSPMPLSPTERKRRSRRSSPRRPAPVQDGYEEEDLPGSFSHAGAFTARSPSTSPHRRERSSKSKSSKEGRSKKDKCGMASLARSLAGTSFRDDNEGCLGGF